MSVNLHSHDSERPNFDRKSFIRAIEYFLVKKPILPTKFVNNKTEDDINAKERSNLNWNYSKLGIELAFDFRNFRTLIH